VREDGALQAAQVAKADAVEFQGFGDEGAKRRAYGLTLLCRMGFTGSVSGLDGEALRASAKVATKASRACALGSLDLTGFWNG
jgi:hypothetical protein